MSGGQPGVRKTIFDCPDSFQTLYYGTPVLVIVIQNGPA